MFPFVLHWSPDKWNNRRSIQLAFYLILIELAPVEKANAIE